MSSSSSHIESLDRDSPKSRRRVRRLLGLPRDAAISLAQIAEARIIARRRGIVPAKGGAL